MGARKNGRARGRLACLLLSSAFFLGPIYFLAPATQASLAQTMKEECKKSCAREYTRSRSPNKGNVGSCWFKVCATSPNNTQQQATTRNSTCNNTQQHVKGCANRRNKSDIQQSWELFGPTLLRPFKRGLRAAEKHEGRICLKRGYFMQDNHHSISLDERISIS